MKDSFLAGFSRRVITPPPGVAMGGYSGRRGVSQGTHDDLFARALVLYDGATKVAILTCDLLLVTGGLTEAIKRNVAEVTDIDENNILVCATHTHSGPMVWLPNQDKEYFFSAGNPIDKKWQEMLPRFLSKTIEDANNSLKPIVEIRIGDSSAKACVNRRTIDPFGDVRLLPNVNKSVDSQIGLLVMRGGEEKILMINYACHPVVLCEDNLLYTGDYPAFVIDNIKHQSKESFKIIFTNGACGNLDPLTRGDFNKASKMGGTLADAVLKGINNSKALEQPADLAISLFTVPLPVKGLPTPAKMQRYTKMVKNILDRHGNRQEFHFKRLKNEYDLSLRKFYLLKQLYQNFYENLTLRRNKEGVTEVEAKIQIIRLGNEAVWIGVPGELFDEIGRDIKSASPFPHTYIIGYCNDYIGYIPTEQAYNEGGYEVQCAFLAQGAGEKLRDAISDELLKIRQM